MGSLLFKWVFLGASVMAVNKFKKVSEAPERIKKQAAGVARRGVVALAGLLVAATILSAGVIIAINNWFVTYQNTGSFSMQASVWGGIVLAVLGATILFFVWPRNKEETEPIKQEREKSDLEKTIILALQGYLEDKRLQKEIKKQSKTHVRSVS